MSGAHPLNIHALPDVGKRARWHSETEWRHLLIEAFPGILVSYWPEPLHRDSALGELSLHFFRAGLLILPPDATPAELLEASVEVAIELANRETPKVGEN